MSKKARKKAKSGVDPNAKAVVSNVAAAAETAPIETDSAAELQLSDTYYFLPEAEPETVDERNLHDLMKYWRHGRATRSIWQALSDGYVTLFSVVILGAMIVNVVISAQGTMAGCDTPTCHTGRLLLPSATIFFCYALALAVGRLFGPVLISAAEGSWLLDAPISRYYLLRSRLAAPFGFSFLAATGVTALVAALSGLGWLQVVIWALAAGLGALALMSFAAARQSLERPFLLKLIQNVMAAIGMVILLTVVSIAAKWLPVATLPLDAVSVALIGLCVVMIVVFAVSLRLTLRRLEGIRRSRLLSGGSLIAGMQGAMFALDFGLIRDILVAREAIEKGHVRPTKGRGLGLNALVWRDVERLKRNPKPFVGLILSLVVPYAADSLGIVQLNPFVSGLALFIALVPFLGSLRVLTRSGGLSRALPFKSAQIRTVVMLIPAILAVIWAACAMPAFVGIAKQEMTWAMGAAYALSVAAAGVLGASRWVTAKKVDFGVPMMATESGAMPPTLIFNLFRGIDVVAVVTAPLILQAGPAWSLGIAMVIFVVVRGTFNMDELKAESDAAQRNLQAAKTARAGNTGSAGATGVRKKVPRPQQR